MDRRHAAQFRSAAHFWDEVNAQFRAPRNLAYLRGVVGRRTPPGPAREATLAGLDDDARAFAAKAARRTALPRDPAAAFWDEVRALNLAFVRRTDAAHAEHRARLDGISDEPYHMRAFEADSMWLPADTPARAADAPEPQGVFDDDAPWSRGDPLRSAEQAAAEYWGDARVETGSAPLRAAGERVGVAYGTAEPASGGTRYMRYETIPFWQRGGSRAYERDIDDDLGAAGGARELDGPPHRVRRAKKRWV